jgi:hypothetical protein
MAAPPQKPLKFIHITKSAGSSIEKAAKDRNILWGRYHTEYGWWHRVFSRLQRSLIDKYDWFMVVRNPYTRILSEYHCRWGGIGSNPKIKHTKGQMNQYLIDKIKLRSRTGDHYTEQSLYLHPTAKIHVLKFETLAEEFPALMATYNIKDIVLGHDNATTKIFTVADFSNELIRLINSVYDKDFTTFGYEKMVVV